eukprot:TRINITY_DN22443_c0_g1_i1.p1 TRINITY_DN22443_c0_g1~~TRINITY_DN22443_c0_g1_i1.p1  ORF type:complete len:470 (-),score=94.76 TRINITY_DN22443_c0_g1_i1:57-1433(-)
MVLGSDFLTYTETSRLTRRRPRHHPASDTACQQDQMLPLQSSSSSGFSILSSRFSASDLGKWCQSAMKQLECSQAELRAQACKHREHLSPEGAVRGVEAMMALMPVPSCFERKVRATELWRKSRKSRDVETSGRRSVSAGACCRKVRPDWPALRQSLLDASAFSRAEVASALATAVGSGPQADELRAKACGFLAQALLPLAGMHGGAGAVGSPVVTAFCPFPLGCVAELGAKGLGIDECAPMELSMQALQRGLLVATFAQGSLGLLRMCLGDFFSGSYTLLLATLGYNSRHPGPASAWLKTYVLISFINGTMGHIDLVQNMLLQNFPVVAATLPLSVNLMHAVQLVIPGVSFCGAFFGWQHLKAQRKAMIEAYQRDLLMMMEQAPWPPPPLYQLPGMPSMPGLMPVANHPAQASQCGCQTGASHSLRSVPEEGEEESEADDKKVPATSAMPSFEGSAA